MTLMTLTKVERPAIARCALFVLALMAPALVLSARSVVEDKSCRREIRQIDRVYDAIRAQIRAKRLIESKSKFEYCEPYADVLRVMHTDDRGVVRHYSVEGGSEDSSVRRDFYYDDQGRLRFALIEARAANDTLMRYRIYCDRSGRRIHESQEHVRGPGYPFPSALSEQDLIRTPLQAFHSANPCQAITEP
jgi:hypothetical protein